MPRSLAYFTDLALRRAEGSLIVRGGDLTVIRSPQNPTFWWGNFLLMPVPPRPGDLTRWTALFTEHHPTAAHRTFGIDTADGDLGAAEEFLNAGYEIHRDTVLSATSTRPPRTVNRDASMRPLSGDADWDAALTLRMAVNDAEQFRHETGAYRLFAGRKLAAYRQMQEAGTGALFGAFDDQGQMLSGLGIFDAGQGIARYQSVETHPDARSRGLAGTLVYTAAQWAREHLGTRTLVIVADPGYHAQTLYESVGFLPTELQIAIQKRPAGE